MMWDNIHSYSVDHQVACWKSPSLSPCICHHATELHAPWPGSSSPSTLFCNSPSSELIGCPAQTVTQRSCIGSLCLCLVCLQQPNTKMFINRTNEKAILYQEQPHIYLSISRCWNPSVGIFLPVTGAFWQTQTIGINGDGRLVITKERLSTGTVEKYQRGPEKPKNQISIFFPVSIFTFNWVAFAASVFPYFIFIENMSLWMLT